MAFDGITVAAVVKELADKTANTRIYKIAQPETDEILLTIKGNSDQFRIVLSADATLPLVYITNESKPSPAVAPNFCMLLRKHLTNARILSVTQPGLERIIRFELEHLNEMGDVCRKYLIVELMGKHSNIIFTDDSETIIDSIKHISHNVSSVREVLPGRSYFVPENTVKADPLSISREDFASMLSSSHIDIVKTVYQGLAGISPLMAHEICYRADIDGDRSATSLSASDISALTDAFMDITDSVKEGAFTPTEYLKGNIPEEYSAVALTSYADMTAVKFDTISDLLISYYREKSIVVRMRQRSADLRKIVTTALERNVKKYDLQLKQLKDTEKKDKYKIYGELINTYGYNLEEGARSFEALNYYTNETVTIPLDPDISPRENAKKYFDKYGKLKRTAENLEKIIVDVESEIEHLRSILTSLDIAVCEDDLTEIREELVQSGYIRFKSGTKKVKITSKPFHYISSDGFDIYVGRNNFQNDKLTFEFANGGDWWFHAKKIPGSHVILKTDGREVPDRAFEEAARLAAHYSSARDADKVEIDYTIRKNVKKPAGSKPGFVVYYTNYSMTIDTDISMLSMK